jgi:hypothetical protein
MAGKLRTVIVDKFNVWKARDDYVRELQAGNPADAAGLARKHYQTAAAIRKRDKLKPPKPWGSWQELETELKQRGQI